LPLFNSVNVVLLHGQQVCSHFGQLLTYWDSIVPDTEWPKFLFVLLSDTKPQLPPQLTKQTRIFAANALAKRRRDVRQPERRDCRLDPRGNPMGVWAEGCSGCF